MGKHCWAIGTVLCCALFLVVLGCGGAKSETGSATPSAQSDRPADPFGGAGDLRAGSKTPGEKVDYDPKDLAIPGSKYGLSKKPKGAKKKCPKGKKGKKCRAQQRGSRKKIPFSDGIAEQMSGIPWGMHSQAIMANFEKKIRQNFADELKKAGGAVEEDLVRSKMLREINKLKRSYVKFDGQRTGYEGAVLEKEFTHNNGESMLEWDAGKFVEYLFFFNGRFWKRLRAFRKDTFSDDITFETYVATLTNRFGAGREERNEIGELTRIRWMNKKTYMTAEDRSGFYGVYCLLFSARLTEDNLAKLRTSAGRKDGSVDKDVSSMVTSATSGELADHNTSVVDSYTGNQSDAAQSGTPDVGHSVMGKKSGEKKEDKGKGKGKGGTAPKKKEAPPKEKEDDSLDIF